MSRTIDLTRLSLRLTTVLGILLLTGCPASGPEPLPVPSPGPAPSPNVTTAPAPSEGAVEEPGGPEDPTPPEEADDACTPLGESELLVELPADLCNTPDAMCLLPDGNLIVSVPNFNDLSQPSLLMKITPDNRAEKFLDLPVNDATGKPLGPLGICLAPSGDLFLADYQMEGERQSRVMRIVIKDGAPQEIAPVITGFHVSNAVICREGYLYVSETQIDPEAKPATSGVFRFKLDELEDALIEVATRETDDPHLIATFETFDEELPLGADGLCFNEQGNLYVGNFADGTVHKLTFDDEGNVASNEVFAKSECMKCADGLFFDSATETIFVADSKANAVQMVSLDGSVQTLAKNGDTDGLDGGMDQPCEVLLRGREVIVSNMDWPVPGCVNSEFNKPCTLSVIKLEE
jgi:sugar lactone lactonase YvrE